ncbi:pyridoxamine 5-phosphate oxidase [Zavarzinia compransoris]|uniref:Pyridoxamine 5-phosphate oxidase n=1 Tax=Zavarzinia compransoris TaxID=1264899 RepID=A0A317E7Z3_9PROT|nr:pyridoxamine 5-phosphate oxidase [Zavarzinia compransoris]
MTDITDIAGLEACIGKPSGAVDLKVIDHLDGEAARWLAAAPLAFVAFGDGDGLAVTLAGGAPGFAAAAGPGRLELPAACLDDAGSARVGTGFGSLFLVPGIGETLRVNGRVAGLRDGVIAVAVEECYAHCAKALIRSDFWAAAPGAGSAAEFPEACRFMALATMDAAGRLDVSPKGDPAGLLLRRADGALWFPERPGNRRTDSYRNILSRPRLAACALVPGGTAVASLSGRPTLTVAAAARTPFAVEGKLPLLVTRVDAPVLEIGESPALARARPWPAAPRPAGIDPAAVFTAHIRLNRGRSLQARLVSTVLAVPGLMEKGLAGDYKKNLY